MADETLNNASPNALPVQTDQQQAAAVPLPAPALDAQGTAAQQIPQAATAGQQVPQASAAQLLPEIAAPKVAEPTAGTLTLVNRLVHARGENVLVDGTYYQIDENGVMADVQEKHARKLLLNRNVWSLHNPRDPVVVQRPRSVALVDDQGRLFHPDMSATRKQVSVQPLQADDSDAATEILHSRDHHASTPALDPLVPDSDTQPVLYRPIDSPDMAQKDGAALGAKHVDEAGFAANVPGTKVKGADEVQAEAVEEAKEEADSEGELGSQEQGTPANEAGNVTTNEPRFGKRGRKGR